VVAHYWRGSLTGTRHSNAATADAAWPASTNAWHAPTLDAASTNAHAIAYDATWHAATY